MNSWRLAITACLAVVASCGDSPKHSPSDDAGALDASSIAAGIHDAQVAVGRDGSSPGIQTDAGLDAASNSGGSDAAASDGGNQGSHDAGPRNINGYLVADHCAPGDYYPAVIHDCVDVPNGVAAAEDAGTGSPPFKRLAQWWWQPDKPMVAGQPYAISVEATPSGPQGRTDAVQLEIWGTMSPCATGGEGAERLAVEGLDVDRVYCHDLHPTKSWTHVIFVFRIFDDNAGVALHGQSYCQTGVCPH